MLTLVGGQVECLWIVGAGHTPTLTRPSGAPTDRADSSSTENQQPTANGWEPVR